MKGDGTMRSPRWLLLSLALLGLAAGTAGAELPAGAPAARLQPLRNLAGTWKGTGTFGDKTLPVTITYATTAAGSAVVEHLFPGTPHEMLSVYTTEGNGLVMTHYCALGNHPKLTLEKSDAHSLSFAVVGGAGLRSPSEMHMHAVTISWTDPDHLREIWTSFDRGVKKDEKVFELARQK
jgi:hypothetical protein